MNFLESFERKALFRFTRSLSLLVIFGIVAAMILMAVRFTGTVLGTADTTVGVAEVFPDEADRERPRSTPLGEQPLAMPDLKLSFRLQRFFSDPSAREALLTRLRTLPSEDRQDYVDNMDQIAAAAEQRRANVEAAIATYAELKDQKLSRADSNKWHLMAQRGAIAISFLSGLFLIALFSVVLVLLAIERNTRTTPR